MSLQDEEEKAKKSKQEFQEWRDSDELEKLKSSIRSLSSHMTNLNFYLQEIPKIQEVGRYIREASNHIEQQARVWFNQFYSMRDEFKKEIGELASFLKEFPSIQQLQELKYMGNRLKEIEDILIELKEDGIKRRVSLSIQCDGIDTKKNIDIEKDEISMSSTQNSKETAGDCALINFLSPKERSVVMHRNGIPEGNCLSYELIGRKLGFSATTAANSYRKAIRKIRQKVKDNNIKKSQIQNIWLRKAIFENLI
jgi:hypothetical protein